MKEYIKLKLGPLLVIMALFPSLLIFGSFGWVGGLEFAPNWPVIIDRIIQTESHGQPARVNNAEWAVGLMQIRKPARDEYNQWTGSNYGYWDMFHPVKNVDVGSFLLTNVFYRYRYTGDLVWTIGAYNAGHTALKRGHFPDSYLTAIIPEAWATWKRNHKQIGEYRDHAGAKIIIFQDPY